MKPERPVWQEATRTLRQTNSPEARAEGFRVWRAKVPWTDAEIIAVLRDEATKQPTEFHRDKYTQYADRLEKDGRLSAYVLGYALPILVKTCALCGKVALYRTGFEGRCRVHRMIPAESEKDRRQRIEARQSMIEDNLRDVERMRKLRDKGRNQKVLRPKV